MSKPYLNLSEDLCNPKTARYSILPIPYEGTVCFLGGTSKGPDGILEISNQMEHFDEELLLDFTQQGIATLPAIPSAETPEKEFDRIYQTVKQYDLFQPGKLPIFLGGEHSVTPPIVRVCTESYDSVSVLQFDAHGDLRHSYTGGTFSHASAMRRVLESTPHLVQVGIRSFSKEEYRDCPERIAKIITPRQIAEDTAASLDRILNGLTDNVYITFDIDAFDPAYAPATGTPEPGGLDWLQVTKILRKVCAEKNIVGADVVEVAPFGGNNVITEYLAVRLVGKMIAYTLK